MSPLPAQLRFAFPPSLGENQGTRLKEVLEQFLRLAVGPDCRLEVVAAESYAALSQALLAGTVELAWAPPFVCARVESAGGRVLARLQRGGEGSFRSALLCRRDRPLELDRLSGVKVAWVDRDSTAGYLLPLAHLRGLGVDPAQAFSAERFVGSYAKALNELAEGRVDLTAVFASAERAAHPYLGALPDELRRQVLVLGFTAETPNDALVASPALPRDLCEELGARLLAAAATAEAQPLLQEAFGADALEASAEHSYQALYLIARSGLA